MLTRSLGLFFILTISAVAGAQVQAAGGPAIDQYFVRSQKVEVEKVVFPAPAPGEKVIVIPLPETENGRIDLDHYQVGISFTTMRLSDACNKMIIYGQVSESTLAPQMAKLYRLVIQPERSSRTMKSCFISDKQVRVVEIRTELIQPQPFSNNLVFYVPENVEVKAQIWQQARTIQGVAP